MIIFLCLSPSIIMATSDSARLLAANDCLDCEFLQDRLGRKASSSVDCILQSTTTADRMLLEH